MSILFNLFGLDTLDMIELGDEKSPALAWSLMDHEGPVLDLRLLGFGIEHRSIWLPKDVLEKLYGRFANLNPNKGVEIVTGEGYLNYLPEGISLEDVNALSEDDELFRTITMDIHYSRLEDRSGKQRLYRLLPELLNTRVLERLASDPALSPALMGQAYKEGALSREYGPRHKRWSPEWAAYVEAYKKAHPAF